MKMLCPICNSAGCEEDCVEIEEETAELKQQLREAIEELSLSQLRALAESLGLY
jgi:uncharacterized protein (DUF2225 family)